jgi:lipopolysaccharide heptosyltransferase II
MSILVKKFGGIGNVILGTPMLEILKRAFPIARVSVLAESGGPAEVLSGNPCVQEIISEPIGEYKQRGRIGYLLAMLGLSFRLRRRRFDLVINGYGGYGGDSLLSALFTFLIGGRRSIGYAGGFWGFLYGKALRVRGDIHEVERNLDLVRAIVPAEMDTGAVPSVWLLEDDRQSARKMIEGWGVSDTDLLIGMHPGSGPMTFKRWDPSNFASLGDRLSEELGAKIVILGGQDDASTAAHVAHSMASTPFDVTGKTTLKETAALIERCRVFVSSDTGLMHVAAALNVPVVAVFGPTDPGRTGPFGEGHVVVRSEVDCGPCYLGVPVRCDEKICLDSVSVDEVMEALRKVIRATDGQGGRSHGG